MKWSHTQTIKEDDLPPSSVTIPYRGAGRMNYDLQILYLSHNHLCFLTGKRKRLKAEMFCWTILKWLCREATCLGHGGALWRLWIRGIRVMGEQNSPSFWQGLCRHPEPFSPNAHCAWQVLEQGLPSWGKAGATSHAVCCFSSDSYSGTVLRHWAASRAPAAAVVHRNTLPWVAAVSLRLLCASACTWRHFFLGSPWYLHRTVRSCLCYLSCCPN